MLAIITGIIIGSAVNMGIIMIRGSIIHLHSGVDITTTEGLKTSMHLFQTKHIIFPLLIGGIANVNMLPSPAWFICLNLLGAYNPMGYFAGRFIRGE